MYTASMRVWVDMADTVEVRQIKKIGPSNVDSCEGRKEARANPERL